MSNGKRAGQVLNQQISLSPETSEPQQPESKPSFWERIHSYSAEDWSRYFIYLYRGRGGANIAKIAHPIDPDWVRQNYGGGDYRALLHDERHRIVDALNFTLEGPPRIVGSEPAQTSAKTPDAGGDSFQAQVLQEIREMNRQIIDLMRERDRNPAAADNSEAVPILLKGAVDMFKGLMPAQSDPLQLLASLKQLIPAQEKTDLLDLLTKAKAAGLIPAAAPAAGGSMLEQLDSLLAVAENFNAHAGGGKAASVMEILAAKAPEIVERIGTIADKWATIAKANREAEYFRLQRSTIAPQPGAPALDAPAVIAQPGAPLVAPPAASNLELEPVGTTAAPAATPAAPEVVQPAAPLDEIDAMKRKIVEGIARGVTGADIVSFMDMTVPALVNTFLNVSEADLADFFSTDPILSQAAKLPRFPEVIHEIVEELSGEEAPESPPN